MLYSLNHYPTCRFEVRQALIYQLVSGLTDENGKYNYAKAVHHYPPFFDISCSAKNYKIASALTGRPAVLRSAEGICRTYRPGAKVYVCSGYPACDSFVMAHPGTLEPMGTLAPPELRRLRYEAHQQFDQLHKSGLMTRREAYQWLAYITQAPMSHAHIGHLGEYYCRVVIRESRKLLAQRTGAA